MNTTTNIHNTKLSIDASSDDETKNEPLSLNRAMEIFNLFRAEYMTVSAGRFVASYKPSKLQGELDGDQVEWLSSDPERLYRALNNPGSRILVSPTGQIIQGNHRTQALKAAVASGAIPFDAPITIAELNTNLSQKDMSVIRYLLNFGTARGSQKQQMICARKIPLSTKLFTPLFEVLEGSPLTVGFREQLVVRLGALINRSDLPLSKISFTGAQLYMARSLPECHLTEFLTVEANRDISKEFEFLQHIRDAADTTGKFIKYIEQEQKSDAQTLKALIGGSRTVFVSIIFAAVIQKRIKTQTFAKVYKQLKAKSGKIRVWLKTYAANATRNEIAICDALGLDIDTDVD